MDRKEHLQWCKDRAIEYLDNGDLTNGFASFMSDMSKHEVLAQHPFLMGTWDNAHSIEVLKTWINGFN